MRQFSQSRHQRSADDIITFPQRNCRRIALGKKKIQLALRLCDRNAVAHAGIELRRRIPRERCQRRRETKQKNRRFHKSTFATHTIRPNASPTYQTLDQPARNFVQYRNAGLRPGADKTIRAIAPGRRPALQVRGESLHWLQTFHPSPSHFSRPLPRPRLNHSPCPRE